MPDDFPILVGIHILTKIVDITGIILGEVVTGDFDNLTTDTLLIDHSQCLNFFPIDGEGFPEIGTGCPDHSL